MKKLLQFIFFKVYCFYEQRWPNRDPDVYAFMYLVLWICWNILFLGFIIYNLLHIDSYFWEENEKLKFLLFIPGLIIFFTFWKKIMTNDTYKKWIKPELFEEPIYNGRSGTLLFWGLFFVPIILAIIMGLTTP